MERRIYFYTCMECGQEWESTRKDEAVCPICKTSDLHVEEVEDDDNENTL